MKKLLFSILTGLLVTTAFAQTNFSGGIFQNTTWTKAKSPYIITGDIALFPGSTLTVEPGVVVKFNGNFKFIVRGFLSAIGKINDSIQFISSSSSPAKSKWIGLQIENDLGGKVNVSYFKGAQANILFEIKSDSRGEVLNISNSTISNNQMAINSTSNSSFSIALSNSYFYDHDFVFINCQNSIIESCIFRKGNEAIHGSSPIVNNSEFSEFTESTTRTAGTYTNCKYYNNENGVKLFPNLKLVNCEIYNNNVGILTFYPFYPFGFSIERTCLYDNKKYDIQHQYNYNIDLSAIRWKHSDSAVIANKIYDAYDNVNFGIIKFSASSQCSPIMSNEDKISNVTSMKVFPNPFSNQTTLQSTLPLNNATLKVYNLFGQEVKSISNISGSSVVFNRDNLPCGLYSIRLVDNNKTYTLDKIIIIEN